MYRADGAPRHAGLTCPRCGADARPAAGVQGCAGCLHPFTLRGGALFDAHILPPPVDPGLPRITVKSAGALLMKRGVVAPEGVLEGSLDPVTGLVPMNEAGVLYSDVFTIAVWRRVDLVSLVVALLIPLPISVLTLVGAFAISPMFLVLGLPLLAIAAFMIWRAVWFRAHMVRIAGAYRTLTIRFDSPMWRRQAFHDELLRRAGVTPGPIP